MQTGFVSQLGMDRSVVLDRAVAMGCDYVELMLEGANARNQLDAEAVDELQGAPVDLLVHLPFRGFDLGSPHEHIRSGTLREYEATLDLIEQFGAQKAVIHGESSAWAPAWPATQTRERIFDSLRQLNESARARGVELAVENIPGGALSTNEFGEFFAQTGANATFDTGHARIDGLANEDLVAFAEAHRDRITHLHLNDVRNPQDEHLPFGAGMVDFESLLTVLANRTPPPTLSLEVFTLDWEYLEMSKRRLDEVLGRIDAN